MTSNNPIPEALPRIPNFRALRLMQPILALAHASLVMDKLQKSGSRQDPKVTSRCLHDRVCFFLLRFRISIHRRIRNSLASGHMRKLCHSFLALNQPCTKIPRAICKLAKAAVAASLKPLAFTMSWWLVRNYICTVNTQPTQHATHTAWPLKPNSTKQYGISILFWNVNGHHQLEHKRTLISQTSEELKVDVIALVETKCRTTAPPIPTFNLCSYRKSLMDKNNPLSIAGGICVGKKPSPDVTARTTLVFDGFIEATATTLRGGGSLQFTLITAYFPPISNSLLRGKYEDQSFMRQLRALYKNAVGEVQPLLMIADANTNIATMLGRGARTIRQLLQDGWEIRSNPDLPTYLGTQGGSCIDIVLSRHVYDNINYNVIPMTTSDHQALHVTISTKSEQKSRLPHTCNSRVAKRFAQALQDPQHPLSGAAGNILVSSQTGNLPDLHPSTAADSSTRAIQSIIQCINSFETAEKLTPFIPTDKLYLDRKGKLRSHYRCVNIYKNTRSHRGLANVYRKLHHLKWDVRRAIDLLRERNSTNLAAKAYETASLSRNLSAISSRIERAFCPNSKLLDIANLSLDESATHSSFWTARWGQQYHLPESRLSALDDFLLTPRHAPAEPLQDPSPRFSSFSITHLPNGDPWLTDTAEVEEAILRLSNNKASGISGLPVDFFKLTQTFHHAALFFSSKQD